MIINKKGTILPVTVIAMTIMMIIGLISLKMFQLRNVLMAEDLLKIFGFCFSKKKKKIYFGRR